MQIFKTISGRSLFTINSSFSNVNSYSLSVTKLVIYYIIFTSELWMVGPMYKFSDMIQMTVSLIRKMCKTRCPTSCTWLSQVILKKKFLYIVVEFSTFYLDSIPVSMNVVAVVVIRNSNFFRPYLSKNCEFDTST